MGDRLFGETVCKWLNIPVGILWSLHIAIETCISIVELRNLNMMDLSIVTHIYVSLPEGSFLLTGESIFEKCSNLLPLKTTVVSIAVFDEKT